MVIWSSFVLNSYCHWSSLVLQHGDGTDNIIHIREGVMQGDTLDMVDYGIGVLLLIKRLMLVYPNVT